MQDEKPQDKPQSKPPLPSTDPRRTGAGWMPGAGSGYPKRYFCSD